MKLLKSFYLPETGCRLHKFNLCKSLQILNDMQYERKQDMTFEGLLAFNPHLFGWMNDVCLINSECN